MSVCLFILLATSQGLIEVKKIKDLTGPGLTDRYQMQATDLGIPVRMPNGRILFVFGDTFQDAHVGSANWRSPVGLFSNTSHLDNGVTWVGAVGGATAQQFWFYEHSNPTFSTVLPSDVVVVGHTVYLHVMVNKGLGNVVWTEIWASQDSGATWKHTGAKFASNIHGGLWQCITWALSSDGYVYIYSTGFQRDKPMIMTRVHGDHIADPAAYQPWGFKNGQWGWGNPATPILEGHFGELCLRHLDGKWILTFFNAGAYRIDALIFDHPTSNLLTTRKEQLIFGCAWGQENNNHVAQLYGGYIIPGSNLTNLHLSVSQWNTNTGWPYRVMQFRVHGL